MSTEYNKTIWQNGDVISVEKLNKIENGIAAVSNIVNSHAIYDTATGSIASFLDGADDLPMKSCVVELEPIQEGEGDPSPENIRPIIGHTGLSVVRSGKNLVDDSIKYVTTTGTSLYIGSNNTQYHLYLPSGTYNFSCFFASGVHYAAYIKKENGSDINIWDKDSGLTSKSFDLDGGIYRIRFYNPAESGGVSASDVSNIMLEVGSTATDYEPYKGETYSVNWETEAGTVYSGTLDVINGKLVVDSVMFNLNTSMMNNAENYPGWKNTGVIDVIGSGVQTANYSVISNIFKNVGVNTTGSGSGAIYLPMQTYIKTQSEWIAEALDVQILFKSINPVEYQLEPQEIRTLLGENNIWSDGGDMAVEYPADTKLYIDRKIAEALS